MFNRFLMFSMIFIVVLRAAFSWTIKVFNARRRKKWLLRISNAIQSYSRNSSTITIDVNFVRTTYNMKVRTLVKTLRSVASSPLSVQTKSWNKQNCARFYDQLILKSFHSYFLGSFKNAFIKFCTEEVNAISGEASNIFKR